jgi:hypothetical protein
VSSADALAEILSGISDVDATLIGTFVGPSGTQAIVDVGSARVTIPALGPTFPFTNEPVRLLRVGKITLMLGPVPRWPVGKVTATGSPRCTVEYPPGSGVTKQMGYPPNITPTVGDTVLIDWASGGSVSTKLTIAPGATAPPDPGGGSGGQQQQVFTAVDSGTWQTANGGRWWQNDVWAVSTGNNTGAWFYGSKIRDTIPDSAAINAAEIYLPIFYDTGSAPIAQVHSSTSKPGGNISGVGGTSALNPSSGWVPIPAAFLDYLKANDGGIALVGGGFKKYRGTASDGQSGALRVTYST